MKLYEMLSDYVSASGDRLAQKIADAEAIVQTIDQARMARAETIEQFRVALINCVNDSIDLMKAADSAEKEELMQTVRDLVLQLRADREYILAGDPTAFRPEAAAPQMPTASFALPRLDFETKPAAANAEATGLETPDILFEPELRSKTSSKSVLQTVK